MIANLGSADRTIRLLLGLVLISLPLAVKLPALNDPTVHYGTLAAGFVLIATAAFRFCPVYRLFGIRTCKA